MRKIALVATSLVFTALASCPQQKAVEVSGDPATWTQPQKVGYVLGRNLGDNVKSQGGDVDKDYLMAAINDALAGKPSPVTPEMTRQVMMDFQKSMMEKRQATMKAEGEKNLAEGQKFLEENKTKEGIKVTASGLQYKVLTAGDGKTPTLEDTVTCNYRGTLVNGTEFDSSYKRNTPTRFPVRGVIKGWTEALQLMKVGDKWQLFIPADLAYGPMGHPPVIPPQSTLIFEIELVGIEGQGQPQAQTPPPPTSP
jgi:FKBP-type peptidyl-prolyl cis-trans isomerase